MSSTPGNIPNKTALLYSSSEVRRQKIFHEKYIFVQCSFSETPEKVKEVFRWLSRAITNTLPYRARVRKGKFSRWRFTSMGTVKIDLMFWLSIFG